MEPATLHFLLAWRPLAYVFVFLGMIFEGDIALFTTAFLTHQGYFELSNIIPIVLIANFAGDIFWYNIGKKLNEHSFFARWTNRIAKPFDHHLVERPFRTIFISKFTYGFNHAILVRAGSLKVNLDDLLKSDVLATLLWMVIVGGLGYFSSVSLSLAKHYLHSIQLAFLFGVLIFLGITSLITWRSKKRL